MIKFVDTVSSAPPGGAARDEWDTDAYPFLFEVGGEVEPEVAIETATSATPKAYEYTWTLANSGFRVRSGTHWWNRDGEDAPLWDKLAESPAARIYLDFPTTSGWRVQEIAATVKYLSPIRVHEGWRDEVSKVLAATGPLATDAAGVAKLLPGGSTAANWLDVVAKLQVQGVPPSSHFDWSVEKVAVPGRTSQASGRLDGVLFNIPRSMFELLGGRVTGSVAVSFVQTGDELRAGELLAHACIRADDGAETWLPGGGSPSVFLPLGLKPRAG